jgi:3-oxoacyl-[acyl-carrier protein] reductase
MTATEPIRGDVDVLSLAGKTALITGGGSGMGRASAELFATKGAHVVIVDRNGEAGRETVDAITAAGGSAEWHQVELTDQQALDAYLDECAAAHDVIDVLFNHAGLPGPPGLDFDAESWTTNMTINVWVPMVVTKRLLPQLRRSRSASVLITASIAGLGANPGLVTYGASKAAVISFAKSAAVMLAPEHIRVNVICPGATDTPALRRDIEDGTLGSATLDTIAQTVPMRRLGTTQDIANTALFLASDASGFLTGAIIPVDGGGSLATQMARPRQTEQ